MRNTTSVRVSVVGIFLHLTVCGLCHLIAQSPDALNYEFVNGQWFDGEDFQAHTFYNVDGHLTVQRPERVDRTLDLERAYIIPPFAEAHNHGIGASTVDEDRRKIEHYLADGVFYVKIQGNLPITEDRKRLLAINEPEGGDMIFAQAPLTATGGHPIPLWELNLARGLFPGQTKESLKDFGYYTIDSEADLESKWPRILASRPDFIKTILLFSEQYEQRKDDVAFTGQKGLDPKLLAKIVTEAHAANLRVTTHVATGADFHNALLAGADEIAHIPPVSAIDIEDAKLAARRQTAVITTCANPVPSLIRMQAVDESDVRSTVVANLKLLLENGVRVAIGSDDPSDSSEKEVWYLQSQSVFDNLGLLRAWTQTAQAIFPDRRIGVLSEGYEASFLALEGNPLTDLENLRRIRIRFKQGHMLRNDLR